ncbi:MAG: DJ-1/PfpI family protein [Phenylobacterium sp.]|uniref:GlxA family transcriptional regulator n=1 Tax=Phenylobacterium sp. TaxID=1871053 RepID=UPI0025CBB9AA|nr:DJ-1/PfpI family protein [Phenylobacterium sp.]MCG9915853.1 DJ-1/PfpI family protein [Phenylobacterium sp.]
MTVRPLTVVIFDDFQILDAAGPIAAFEIASRFVTDGYDLKVVAPGAGWVKSSSGAAMLAQELDDRPLDTLLVAGGDGTRPGRLDPRVVALVAAAAARASRIVSICSGAFILAEAGLLNGRRATTHWNRTADFRRRFPLVQLQPDRIYVRDGPVWTSAGITAGIDLALALIAEDLGEIVARATAQHLVAPRQRPGGQSQFSGLVEMGGATGRFAELLNGARQRLTDRLGVEDLAHACAMSPRNFARAFVRDVGMTPAKAIEHLRVQAARDQLEAGASVEQAAMAAGFGDAERLRRAMLRSFGQPPQALRRTARAQA